MHEYVPETASQIIITVGTLHNNHRNLREFSLQLRFIQFTASVLRRRVYLSFLLLVPNYFYGRIYSGNARRTE